jgi:hypothetical protein
MFSQLLERVAKLEQDYKELETKFERTNTKVMMAQALLRPISKPVLEVRLDLRWKCHRQVQRIFDQPALVTLLKTYIRMHIPSGNPVDFHKSFVYSLMDRELFARSYLEEVG